MKGDKRYKFPVIKSLGHRAVRDSIGNIVNSIIITLYNGRWLLDLAW